MGGSRTRAQKRPVTPIPDAASSLNYYYSVALLLGVLAFALAASSRFEKPYNPTTCAASCGLLRLNGLVRRSRLQLSTQTGGREARDAREATVVSPFLNECCVLDDALTKALPELVAPCLSHPRPKEARLTLITQITPEIDQYGR
jgi:hypothetical protein